MGILRLLLLSSVAQQQLQELAPRTDAVSMLRLLLLSSVAQQQHFDAGITGALPPTQVSNWATSDELFDDFDPDFAVAQPEDVLDICGEVTAGDVTGDLALSKGTLLYALGSELKHLFGTFSFKGLGVSFRKSLVDLQSTGVYLVLPVSTNFPVYDSMFYYPRLSLSMGVSYPSTYHISVTGSLPSRVLLIVLLLLTEDNDVQATAKKTNTTDSVRRLGFTCSLRYSKERGYIGAIGPYINYLPGLQFLDLVKQPLLVLPTLLFTLVKLIANGVLEVMQCLRLQTKKVEREGGLGLGIPANIKPKASPPPQAVLAPPTATDLTPASAPVPTAPATPVLLGVDTALELSGFPRNMQRLFNWLRRKSPSFSYSSTLLHFSQSHDKLITSNLIFSLEPFFPFHKHLQRLR
eukprot:CAMPEP_0173179972 /NCGR_PEP_ID=MMETSP1141-20130122/6439_1 /TAXON_ID=483371 /ORGANISM="non described non described, Strain CCMP2298" /LENGTH=406 /DNA_ID=CAMNT_0014102735 /DNA_START=66 /DNA_END=1284 /DNA_ORIENTATION=-